MSDDLTDEELAKVEQVLSIYGRPPDVLMSRRLIAALRASRAEVESLREALDAAQLRSIEARNPGIDMDEVRRVRSRPLGDRRGFRVDL